MIRTYIDERGPYIMEMVANADQRNLRPNSIANHFANELSVHPSGRYCYFASGPSPYRILYLPHYGDGEPQPESANN